VTDLASDEGFNSHRHPQFLPDGRHFLYLARAAGRIESEIRMASLDGGPAKVVARSPTMGYYASGHLVYVSHGVLVARPFDPATGELGGSPVSLVENVLTVPGAAKAAYSVSGEGTLVYLEGETVQEASLVWYDRHGVELGKAGDQAAYDMVALSPDGRSAAAGVVTEQSGTWDIWVVDLERDFRTRFTFDPGDDADVVWSDDSRTIYFTSDRDGGMAIFRKEVGSPEPPREVLNIQDNIRLWDVSADGRTLFYSQGGKGTAWDLWSVDLDGEAPPRLLHGSAESDVFANLSPDGRWLAFATQESGQSQVYVVPWPAMSPFTQVSTTSGTWSAWTKDGAELVFQEMTGRLMAAPMTPEDGRMRIGKPEQLFELGAPVLESVYWSVSRDGERFLTVNAHDGVSPASCNVVLGWTALLEGR
jgi:Tol biopolymer transport system component